MSSRPLMLLRLLLSMILSWVLSLRSSKNISIILSISIFMNLLLIDLNELRTSQQILLSSILLVNYLRSLHLLRDIVFESRLVIGQLNWTQRVIEDFI